MAKVTLNKAIGGIRGKVDGFVYRDHYGQTVVMPHAVREDKPSAAQLDHRSRFRAAQAYAKAVLADPLKRDCYCRLGLARKCPPNALLVSNFLNPPTIDQVDFSAYQGRMDDVIRVLASDAIEVLRVSMVVLGSDGATLESGPATKDHDLWVYRCTTAHSGQRPLRLEITAENRAGTKVLQAIPFP